MTHTTDQPSPFQRILQVGSEAYLYYALPAAYAAYGQCGDLSRLPFALKIVLENLLRHGQDEQATRASIEALGDWIKTGKSIKEISFMPARILMQDFTGVPALVDLAAMRDVMAEAGGDPGRISPQIPVDLVIDHSVTVDRAGDEGAFDENVRQEMLRNHERYTFLRWGQAAFENVRVVPPGTGICHQVNLEYLGQVVWTQALDTGEQLAYPDTLVGMDSHTTMINGLGILGWGVGGIEAEAAMLGQAISLQLPRVVGVELSGRLPPGSTATDLVLRVTEMLRQQGVVGCFVEFFGSGLSSLSLPDRATIANMAPEYGATCGLFPIDVETLRYLILTGRDPQQVALVEAYARAQGFWHDDTSPRATYSVELTLDLTDIKPCVAGPRRPQDRVALSDVAAAFRQFAQAQGKAQGQAQERPADNPPRTHAVLGKSFRLQEGAVVIAAITSCTNTSNPTVMMAAGLLARNARRRGLQIAPWVKTSLAPGSKVVTDYLQAAGLQAELDQLGFNLVGYGCTTCIGNSGPLDPAIAGTISQQKINVCAVLSGNRNFEGRIHPQVTASFLCSPPLVVAYALAGRVDLDLTRDPLGLDPQGQPVFLSDLWPDAEEIAATVAAHVNQVQFRQRYADVFTGTRHWQALAISDSQRYPWDSNSTYVRYPSYFDGLQPAPPVVEDIVEARILALLGDSVTTDHISPAGSIDEDSPAGAYLQCHGVEPAAFNSYGSRRGNHEVMMRGTFANPRLQNLMTPQQRGGVTRLAPSPEIVSIFAAAQHFQQQGVPLVVFAGAEYGTGSSRDWAAKGPSLLGVRAVIAESFERIHRSNLIGMGILPLQLESEIGLAVLKLTGDECISIAGLAEMTPGSDVSIKIQPERGNPRVVKTRCRIDTQDELRFFHHGGILHCRLRELIAASIAKPLSDA
ncbi:aconitate hydratase AcnA [Pontibacterium granulatum]|uniref:aconitate hydratase AcnA n=1 Tax=Pontibacterium granulatum TaxID=2036029 RepID=UPI00249C0CEF|nr:aconitate hydratase AcnA [Pontibacterium granulatum]MDI3323850.1 aconitate hydratase AcnA [Pontibacterium granulatum]